MDRLGLLKPCSIYQDSPFLAEDPVLGQTTLHKLMGVEFFSMLRTGMDIRAEFENSEELRRYRESYILHILDYVLQDKERIHHNDIKLFDENNKDYVTLDNVFALASKNKAIA